MKYFHTKHIFRDIIVDIIFYKFDQSKKKSWLIQNLELHFFTDGVYPT